jgi:hypothetical protein
VRAFNLHHLISSGGIRANQQLSDPYREEAAMSEGNSSQSFVIPKFDGDYDHWSLIMENLLRSKEY